LRLGLAQHTEGTADLHIEALHLTHEVEDRVEIISVLYLSPRGAHAKSSGALLLSLKSLRSNHLKREDRVTLNAGFVVRGLWAVGAILRASSGLHREKGRALNLARIKR
jgi:hypothetical protein